MYCMDHEPIYHKYKNDVRYATLHLLLIKNIAKDAGIWYKMLIGDSDNYLT